jgi:hypothetical protein
MASIVDLHTLALIQGLDVYGGWSLQLGSDKLIVAGTLTTDSPNNFSIAVMDPRTYGVQMRMDFPEGNLYELSFDGNILAVGASSSFCGFDLRKMQYKDSLWNVNHSRDVTSVHVHKDLAFSAGEGSIVRASLGLMGFTRMWLICRRRGPGHSHVCST